MWPFSWWRERQRTKTLFEKACAPVKREIDGLGEVHIRPLNVSERIAVTEAISEEGDVLTVYIWLLSIAVKEFSGMSAKTLGKKLPRVEIIRSLVEAIFEVSGLTASSQEDVKKNSPPTEKSNSSGKP